MSRRTIFPKLAGSVLYLTALINLPAPPTTYTWIGNGAAGVVSDAANWQSGSTPAGSGSVNEDVIFGVATGSAQSVVIPISGLTLHDLTFNGGSTRPAYTFSGTSNPTFTVTGDITANDGGNILLNSSFNIGLGSDGTNNGHTITVAGSTLNVTVAGNVSDSGSAAYVVKEGTGSLTLSGNNTYTGDTNFNAGTLNINSATAIGTGTLRFQNSGLTLDNTSGSAVTLTSNNAQVWNASFTFTGTNALALGTGNVTLEGSRQITVTNSTLTVGGAIANGEGTGVLTKAGAGTLVLGGVSTYSGGTTVNAGTLLIGASSTASGASVTNGPVGTGTLTLKNGTTLGQAVTNSTIALHNAITLDTSAGTATLNSAGSSGQLNLSGIISGTGGLTTTGTGLITLSGANTFTGGITINGTGFVDFKDSNTAAGTGKLAFTANTRARFWTAAPTINGLESTSGATNSAVELRFNTAPRLTINQNFDSTFYGDLRLDNGSGTNNDGVVVKAGTGSLTLNSTFVAAHNGQGSTHDVLEVQGGTLVLDGVTFEEATTAMKINGGALKIASGRTLSNPVVVAAGGGTLTGPGTVNGTVALNTSLTLESPTSNILTVGGVISGTGGLTKTGAGSVTLSGTNTYTGGTIINGGILTLSNASALGSTSASVTVNNGGTLALNNVTTSLTPTLNSGSKLIGKGTLNNAVIGSNVTLSPGTSTDRIGTLNFTDLTLGQGGILEIHVRYDGEGFLFDQINVSSTETLTISANAANPLTLKLISLNSDSLPGQLDGTSLGTTRTLNSLISTNGISGSLTLGSNLIIDSQNFTTGSPGANFGFTRVGNNYNLSFTPTTAVPEPSTYALLALGLGALGLQLKRRRRA